MSQSQLPPDKGSSVRELDVERVNQDREDVEKKIDAYISGFQDAVDKLTEKKSKEERLERASELMESTEATDLDLEIGEIEKVSSDTIVERTESGFNLYVVVE